MVDITVGQHTQESANECVHKNNEHLHGNWFFSRPHIVSPLEIQATSIVDYLVELTVSNLIQRNSVPIPPSSASTFIFRNPSENLPPPLAVVSLDTPHFLTSLPLFCDLPDFHQMRYLVKIILKASILKHPGSQFAKTHRAETSDFIFTELLMIQESTQEEYLLDVPGYNTNY